MRFNDPFVRECVGVICGVMCVCVLSVHMENTWRYKIIKIVSVDDAFMSPHNYSSIGSLILLVGLFVWCKE